MQAYEFYATPKNGIIKIPEQFEKLITSGVKVILLEQSPNQHRNGELSSGRKSEMLLPPHYQQRDGSSTGRKPMSDKAFLDTNVLVYFYSDDDIDKRNAAHHTLDDHSCVTSIQAMNDGQVISDTLMIVNPFNPQ